MYPELSTEIFQKLILKVKRIVELKVKHITSTPQGKKSGGNLSEKSLFGSFEYIKTSALQSQLNY